MKQKTPTEAAGRILPGRSDYTPRWPRGILSAVKILLSAAEVISLGRRECTPQPSRVYTLDGREDSSWPLRVYTLNGLSTAERIPLSRQECRLSMAERIPLSLRECRLSMAERIPLSRRECRLSMAVYTLNSQGKPTWPLRCTPSRRLFTLPAIESVRSQRLTLYILGGREEITSAAESRILTDERIPLGHRGV
ncbi:uncharacterized protein PGTG_18237 [Puccinia graminis f. sp. tritici CRL 75-36-700-3]|uniref:Uncharacterized protein n=1 Tax=Puccinia graminis f. sp. tritici (strain CRL 75-36-700-3 / race SCCL) TaxID=418459 RepID=E3L787_PUCGT|nr:uncharacterized protein PGTG_18237 [Puccinia graminis f. sp. tritici CRL 75-36-700-3]EFP92412.1 hypothetical protein PGTG_18237 [Puccinia graminis f. sp. tritici CRL 75-36-700-3]